MTITMIHSCVNMSRLRLLQKRVRDPRAGYFQSLDVLKAAKACGVYTKSSIMLGLGETYDEIIDTMYDLKDAVRAALASLTGHKQTLLILLT